MYSDDERGDRAHLIAFVEQNQTLPDIFPPNSDPQRMFLTTDADIGVIGGSAGGGKTVAELLEPTQSVRNKDFNAVIFRRTMKQVKDEGGIWDQAMDLYPLIGGKPNLTERFWTFPSGASIQFAGLENEGDKVNWKGAQICDILFDELTEFLESQFWYLMSRNRSTCGEKRRVRASTNPAPGWVKRLLAPWVDLTFPNPAKSGEIRWLIRQNDQIVWVPKPPLREPCTKGPDNEGCYLEGCESCFPPEKSITFIRATVYDNRDLLKANPDYISSLQIQDDVEMRRLLKGDWDAKPSHLMIDAFDETRNVVSWRQLDPKDYRFYIGGDFGGHNTAEVCIAEEIHSGHLIWCGEDWPGMSRGWDAISADTRSIVPPGGHITDGAGGNRTGEQGWREAFRSRGIPMSEPDPLFCEPKLQYQNMNNLFRSAELTIMDTCVKTIGMLNAFLRKVDPRTGIVTDDFDDAPYHLLAAGRYIITKLRPPVDRSPAIVKTTSPAVHKVNSQEEDEDIRTHFRTGAFATDPRKENGNKQQIGPGVPGYRRTGRR